MASVRLTYSTTDVDFNPSEGFNRTDITNRPTDRAQDGTLHSHDFHTPKKRWIVPIRDISSASASSINGWWENNRDLTWTPDYTNDSATTYTVKIRNAERPMYFRNLKYWETHYSGTLQIEET